MDGLVGVTDMDTSVAAVTVRVLDCVESLESMPPNEAEIKVVPVATGVARPSLEAALLTVAVPGVADAQVTSVVMSRVELSE